MKTATKTFTALTAAAVLATGMFAGSTGQAEAGWKHKYHHGGAFVAGAIVGSALAHGHHNRHRYYARECWYERRLVKVGRNTYKKRNVEVCR